jgi:hypothetical protein
MITSLAFIANTAPKARNTATPWQQFPLKVKVAKKGGETAGGFVKK